MAAKLHSISLTPSFHLFLSSLCLSFSLSLSFFLSLSLSFFLSLSLSFSLSLSLHSFFFIGINRTFKLFYFHQRSRYVPKLPEPTSDSMTRLPNGISHSRMLPPSCPRRRRGVNGVSDECSSSDTSVLTSLLAARRLSLWEIPFSGKKTEDRRRMAVPGELVKLGQDSVLG